MSDTVLKEIERVILRIRQHEDCLDRINWTDGNKGCTEFYNQVEYTTTEIKKLEDYLLVYLRSVV